VTTYAILRRDIEELSKLRFRYAMLDEAQYIKNWATTTAKSAKQLKADHRLALSGTPVENHLVDLWAIFDFLAPGFLGKLSEFQKNYVRPIEDGDVKVLEGLRSRIRPFVLRRKKEDVASELPPKTEQTLFVQFQGAAGPLQPDSQGGEGGDPGAHRGGRPREVADDDPRGADAPAPGLLRPAPARPGRRVGAADLGQARGVHRAHRRLRSARAARSWCSRSSSRCRSSSATRSPS
jgi:hypothetical protein